MPYIETPDDLADWLADKIGVYGACKHEDGCPDSCEHSLNTCPEESQFCCRVKFNCEMADRIRAAVRNEGQLADAQRKETP